MAEREKMNIVIVGHVDHGKSTVIGRLLADTGSLPEGKLEAVKALCARTARPFEYAFLLDALKDEQAQGITIDAARCFFKSARRDYILIDAPGHIEFLKNMVTGASRAEAAVLVIDAHEGIRENSKRHGYMLSFLGITHLVVAVNKMDLVGYRQDIFVEVRDAFRAFLEEIRIEPAAIIPISGREGDNVAASSRETMPWYDGPTLLEALDGFRKAPPPRSLPLRLPVQDVYKFTEEGDDRRIVAGRIETGALSVGEELVFYPSGKTARVTSIEAFNRPPPKTSVAGESTGVCLDPQIYIRPGEIACRRGDAGIHVCTRFRAHLFWMGRRPMVPEKIYKLKLVTQQVPVRLLRICGVLDASDLSSVTDPQAVRRHDVADGVFETLKPIAFDEVTRIPATGRFVIVDHYEISGGGIVLAPVYEEETTLKAHIARRERSWVRGGITPETRARRFGHKSAVVIITGEIDVGKQEIAKALEERLFAAGRSPYFLGISNEMIRPDERTGDRVVEKLQLVRQLGELAHVLADAGLILVTSVTDVDVTEMEILKALNHPHPVAVVNVGEARLAPEEIDLHLEKNTPIETAVRRILDILEPRISLEPEYMI